MLVVPKSMRDLLTLVAVDLRGERADSRLKTIDRYVDFAHKYELIRAGQESELVELLINGTKFEDAVSELRSAY